MNKILAAVLTALFAFAGWSADRASAVERYGKQKVVYHINYNGGDGSRAYKAALNNIQNHINAVGAKNLELKVVLHGNGIYLLRDAVKDLQLQGTVSNLKRQNIAFAVCKNTLTGRKINAEKDLFEVFEDDIVPSGVAELARLQSMGYTYIKP